jgi:hypothetical protein
MLQAVSSSSCRIDYSTLCQLQLLQATARFGCQYQRLQEQVKRIDWARFKGSHVAVPASKTGTFKDV